MLKLVKSLIICACCFIVMGLSVLYGFSGYFSQDYDMEEQLRPDAASQFYDIKGNIIYTTLSEERRVPIPLEQIPKHTQLAFIAIEDNRFYDHGGIDFRGTARALVSTLSGREVQGGSTITQQLAKNAFLTQERTIVRKLKEAFIARELENKYTKDQILNMYLNHIYFGNGAYGVESASMYYFGKHARDLDIAESATLAAIPKSPNYFNPFENPNDSKERQELVIDQMVKYGFIDQAIGDAAKAEKLQLRTTAAAKQNNPRFYFFDMITQKVIDEVGAEALYKGGLKIYTTLDMDMQLAAEKALHHLPNYYNDDNKLTQPQIALAAVDPRTGHVKAMLGGRGEDKFNRATLAARQTGSAFKPFVYVTAMEQGFTPASIIDDREEEFAPGWVPQNHSKKEMGKVTLRTALKLSLNVPTVKLAREVGVNEIVDNAKKMGISTLVDDGKFSDANLAMALGGLSKGVSPLEMASAYGVLAANGTYCRPFALLRIVDRTGAVLYERHTESKQAIDPAAAYMTTNILQDVLISGTGAGAGIGRPAAGKTGTTDTYIDAWFVGYTPDLSTAVWVGDDNNKPLDHMYGSGTPLSVWNEFMVNALAHSPALDFVNPGVTIPAEPEIIQDNYLEKMNPLEFMEADGPASSLTDEEKERAERKRKQEREKARKEKKEKEEREKAEKAEKEKAEKEARRSMKDRVNEVLGRPPVVSNQPVRAEEL